jgi:Ca2+-binding RTX toxin-like protein
MIVDVKGTKQAEESESGRERFLLKTGTVFSNIPVYFMMAIAGILLYLKNLFPSEAVKSDEEEYTGAIPEQEASPVVADLLAPEKPKDEAPEKPPASGSYLDRDEGSFVLVESPEVDFQFSPVSVTDKDGLFNFRPRAGNDNLDFAGRGEGPQDPGPGPGGGNNGGGNGGGDDGGDDDDDEEPELPNRAPRSATPYLGSFVSGHSFVITFAMLLQSATDADADTLTVSNLFASSGTLKAVNGGWLFTPEEGEPGFVTFHYLLKDGSVAVWQTAYGRIVLHHEVNGTPGDDILIGSAHMDQIDGGAGDDNIDARGADDIVDAGAGDDNIVAGSGDDIVYGGAGNDRILAGSGNDIVWAGAGNDQVFGESGDDQLFGEEGDDKLFGGVGADLIKAGTGNDEADGGEGDDAVFGDEGDDTVRGGVGKDVVNGGGGSDKNQGGDDNDTMIASADAASDTHDGGEGDDTIVFEATGKVVVDLATGVAESEETGEDLVVNIENVVTGDGDDTIAAAADGAENKFDGGKGLDTLDLSASARGVLVDLNTGKAVGVDLGEDFFKNIERVVGTNADDIFVAGTESVSLRGGGGEDEFRFTTVALGSAEHEIEDFDVGDRIAVEELHISREAARDVQDLFDDIYGDGDYRSYQGRDGRHIRYRNDRDGDRERTKIEADLDGDTRFELSINLDGHHVLFIAENIA